jgi:hypothetical protein
VAIATLTPFVGAGLAYVLWWISNERVVIGPLDRAKFGWLVVAPVWSLTPVAAAYAWRALSGRQAAAIAAVVGLILTLVAAALFWAAMAFPDCQFGAVRMPAELILPSLFVGAVIGGGFAASCLACTTVLRGGHRWIALLVGAGAGFLLIFAAVLAASLVIGIGTGICQRPPLT